MPSNTSLENGGIVGVDVAKQTDVRSYVDFTKTMPGEPRYYVDDAGFPRLDAQQAEFAGQVKAFWDTGFEPPTAVLYVAVEVPSGEGYAWKPVQIGSGGVDPGGGVIFG